MITQSLTLVPAFRKDLPIIALLIAISVVSFKCNQSIQSILSESIGGLGIPRQDKFLSISAYSLVLIPLLGVIWTLLTTYFTSYEFTRKRLIYRTGVLNRVSNPIEYYRIKDVIVETSFIDTIFRLSKMAIVSTDRTYPNLSLAGINFHDVTMIEPDLRDSIEKCMEGGRGREIDIV